MPKDLMPKNQKDFTKILCEKIREKEDILELVNDKKNFSLDELNLKDLSSAIHCAIECKQMKALDALLKNGADPKVLDGRGRTAFFSALDRDFGGGSNIVNTFLDLGVDPDLQDMFGLTPLHVAGIKGCINEMQCLLKREAKPNIQNKEGNTPLHCAIETATREHFKNPENATKFEEILTVISILVKAGASSEIKNKQGKTPIDLLKPGNYRIINAINKGLQEREKANPGVETAGAAR